MHGAAAAALLLEAAPEGGARGAGWPSLRSVTGRRNEPFRILDESYSPGVPGAAAGLQQISSDLSALHCIGTLKQDGGFVLGLRGSAFVP